MRPHYVLVDFENVQPRNLGREFRDRAVVLGEIVDEDRPRRPVFVENGFERRPLRPLVGEDAQVDAV